MPAGLMKKYKGRGRPKGSVSTKKIVRRKGQKRNRLMNLSLQVQPIVMYRKMRYASVDSLTLSNALQAQKRFSLNGLYDPDISGIGHQPLGFDEMMTLYNKYTVLGAKVHIKGRVGSTANTYPMNLIAEQSELSSIQYTSGGQPLEKPTCKVVTYNSSATNVYNPEKRITLWFSAKKAFRARGRRDLISNDEYNGDSSSNPDHQQFLYVTYQGQGLQLTTAQLFVDTTIEYIVAFHDRKQLFQS